jgi:hypothetical protein
MKYQSIQLKIINSKIFVKYSDHQMNKKDIVLLFIKNKKEPKCL